jgi:hypothetical protein
MPFLAAGGIVPAANAAQSAGRNRHGWNEQMDNDADSILATLQGWRTAGKPAALATVVSTWGSSPRPEGSHLAVDGGRPFSSVRCPVAASRVQ